MVVGGFDFVIISVIVIIEIGQVGRVVMIIDCSGVHVFAGWWGQSGSRGPRLGEGDLVVGLG